MPKIKNVFKWVNGVENEIYPGSWKPGDNTIAYMPFTTNLVNQITGNGPSSTRGTPTIENGALKSGGALYYDISQINVAGPRTIASWIKPTEQRSYTQRILQFGTSNTLFLGLSRSGSGTPKMTIGGEGDSRDLALPINEWHFWVVTYDGTSTYVYKDNGDGVLYTWAWGNAGAPSGTVTQFLVGINNNYDYYSGYLGETILENKVWGSDEPAKYFNKTKGNYGF